MFNIKAFRTFWNCSKKLHSRTSCSMDHTGTWPDPCTALAANLSDFAKQQLEKCKDVNKPCRKGEAVDLDQFMKISETFPAKFGTDSCRVKSQPAERRQHIRQQIASAYPIIHERTLFLYMNFLEHKLAFGNSKELSVYKELSVIEFVQRLLSKRCVFFFGSEDFYKLLDGQSGTGGFERIGSREEQEPLLLENVLSYDEIKLSALLYVSNHSEFINDGSRSNAGRVEQNKSKIETEGVIMGLIGARFERDNVMEYQDIMITAEQNTAANGYGSRGSGGGDDGRLRDYRRIWRDFYEERKSFSYEDVNDDDERFSQLPGDQAEFDNLVMSKRYAISFDTLLLEAEARAAEAGKPAYIHVVGIGLGVWKVVPQQEQIFLETIEQRMRALSERLTHIGVVHFSWFHLNKWHAIFDGACIAEPKHPQGGIQVHMSVRNPADKLTNNMLPIVTYAWDGNALPGNEFWAEMLVSTGDPAAACSTLITELQNPHINKEYMCGSNLHIASLQHGVLHISDYAEKVLG